MPEQSNVWKILNALALSAGVSIAALSGAEAAVTPEERTAYEAATGIDTIDSLQEFLILYPVSDLVPRVFQRLNAKIITPDARIAPAPLDLDNPQLAVTLLDGSGPTTSIY